MVLASGVILANDAATLINRNDQRLIEEEDLDFCGERSLPEVWRTHVPSSHLSTVEIGTGWVEPLEAGRP